MERLEEKLGYKFKTRSHLTEAFTPNNQKLKSIGNSVLNLLTVKYTILSNNTINENAKDIKKLKEELSSKAVIQIGKNLEIYSTNVKATVQEEVIKAVIGAIFVDAGGCKKAFVTVWKVFVRLGELTPTEFPPLVTKFNQPFCSSLEFLQERYNIRVNVGRLEEKLGFEFKTFPHLLELALTDDSLLINFYFQTLRVLGSHILGVIVSEQLFNVDPKTLAKFNWDTEKHLYVVQIGRALNIQEFVLKSPEVGNKSCTDFVYSLIGAVYVHSGVSGLKKCSNTFGKLMGFDKMKCSSVESLSSDRESVSSGSIVGGNQGMAKANVNAHPGKTLQPGMISKKINPGGELKATQDIKVDPVEKDPAILHMERQIHPSFKNPLLTALSLDCIQNVEIVGRRVIDFLVLEYVIIACPGFTGNMNAKLKDSLEDLAKVLSSSELIDKISAKFKLRLYKEFGLMFLDQGYDSVRSLFYHLWSGYATKQTKSISSCFPSTAEDQSKFRAHVTVNMTISNSTWKKLESQLSYTFANRNYAEQALTDEKSQGYAKHACNANFTGVPFAFHKLGKCVVDLFFAKKSFFNTIENPRNFDSILTRFEISFYNTTKSRLPFVSTMFVRARKYPYPPKKNPNIPFYGLFGAVYVDAGGGSDGVNAIEFVVVKQNPQLMNISKGKEPSTKPNVEDVPVVDVSLIQHSAASPRCGANFSPVPGTTKSLTPVPFTLVDAKSTSLKVTPGENHNCKKTAPTRPETPKGNFSPIQPKPGGTPTKSKKNKNKSSTEAHIVRVVTPKSNGQSGVPVKQNTPLGSSTKKKNGLVAQPSVSLPNPKSSTQNSHPKPLSPVNASPSHLKSKLGKSQDQLPNSLISAIVQAQDKIQIIKQLDTPTHQHQSDILTSPKVATPLLVLPPSEVLILPEVLTPVERLTPEIPIATKRQRKSKAKRERQRLTHSAEMLNVETTCVNTSVPKLSGSMERVGVVDVEARSDFVPVNCVQGYANEVYKKKKDHQPANEKAKKPTDGDGNGGSTFVQNAFTAVVTAAICLGVAIIVLKMKK